jgi:hypothetical protein
LNVTDSHKYVKKYGLRQPTESIHDLLRAVATTHSKTPDLMDNVNASKLFLQSFRAGDLGYVNFDHPLEEYMEKDLPIKK